MKTTQIFFGGVSSTLAICALLFAQQPFGLLQIHAAEKSPARSAPNVIVNTNALHKDTSGITSFGPVVKRVAPSVVTIYSSKMVRRSSNSPFDDPLFRRFFGPPGEDEGDAPPPRGRGNRRGPSRDEKDEGVGSGVIISSDGYILSNNHVVEGADVVKVTLTGRADEYIAKVVGTDPSTDISVLKIDAKDLPHVTITDSDNLQVGDIVLAVGNPFGVGQTVTMGIVSATGRGFGITSYDDFIQTDAAINMGNSGGALVDAAGRLVGINTAIISPTGGSIGIGFAVPVNMARRVMDSIISEGKVVRGYLGIRFAPEITAAFARKFGLSDRSGALVDEVMPDSPAAKAGIHAGDVITELNGRKVPDGRQFRLWVSQTAPNSKVTFKVFRDGKEQKMSATLGELQMDQLAGRPSSRSTPPQKKTDALEGVEVSDLDQVTRRQAGVPPSVVGALVTSVDPDSTAAEAGLREGNVILEIDRRKIKNAQEAIDITDKIKDGAEILLRVWSAGRDGTSTTRYLMVEPTKPVKENRENR